MESIIYTTIYSVISTNILIFNFGWNNFSQTNISFRCKSDFIFQTDKFHIIKGASNKQKIQNRYFQKF